MKIVPYNPKYKADFIKLNKKWIEEMFVLEKEDIKVLNNIETYIEQGGEIFFAIDEKTDEVMSCCMIQPLSNGEWEIAKFASNDNYKGLGAGSMVLGSCIDYAKERKIAKVVVVTNTKCQAAIHLYKKFGFREVPVDYEKFPFERANAALELEFEYK